MGFVTGGTGLGGSPVPPQIRETETSAFNENMKDLLGMLPFGSSEIISWAELGKDEVFQYKTESGRPMLHPLLFLRTAPDMDSVDDEVWQPIYDDLLDHLPPEIKEWLEAELQLPFADRDLDSVALNHVLTFTAKAIGWLTVVNQPIEPNSPAATYQAISTVLPYVAMQSMINQTEFALETASAWLEDVGANHIHFDFYSSSLSDISDSIIELMALHREVEQNLIREDVKFRFVETANRLHELAAHFNSHAVGNELHILGAQLDALATVSAALALSNGTPSLLIGTSIALIGLNNHASELNLFGEAYNTVLDAILGGVLDSFTFGPRAEMDELLSLLNDLEILKHDG